MGDRCIYKIHGWYSTSFLRHTKCYNLSGPEIITKKKKKKQQLKTCVQVQFYKERKEITHLKHSIPWR